MIIVNKKLKLTLHFSKNVRMKNTISAGDYHSLGLQRDGTLIDWGYCVCKQLKCPDKPFIAIAVGFYHSLGLRTDCKVIGWVSKDCKIYCPDEPFIAIATSYNHSLGLRADWMGAEIFWSNRLFRPTIYCNCCRRLSFSRITS